MALNETEVQLAHVIDGPPLIELLFAQFDPAGSGEHERVIEFMTYLMWPGFSMEARLETNIFGCSRYRRSDTHGEWRWILKGSVLGVALLGRSTDSSIIRRCYSIQHKPFLLSYRPRERQGMLYVLPNNRPGQTLLTEIILGKQIQLEEWGNVLAL